MAFGTWMMVSPQALLGLNAKTSDAIGFSLPPTWLNLEGTRPLLPNEEILGFPQTFTVAGTQNAD
jgi:hypothetical protein